VWGKVPKRPERGIADTLGGGGTPGVGAIGEGDVGRGTGLGGGVVQGRGILLAGTEPTVDRRLTELMVSRMCSRFERLVAS